ncbi:hypothetical protein EMIT0P74_190044 [Pseudomonas sp. IT-P74]
MLSPWTKNFGARFGSDGALSTDISIGCSIELVLLVWLDFTFFMVSDLLWCGLIPHHYEYMFLTREKVRLCLGLLHFRSK